MVDSCAPFAQMRILMISQWFDPEPADVKGLPFARELARRGHDVVVITGFPNYPGGKVYLGYQIKCWQRERWNGIDAEALRASASGLPNVLFLPRRHPSEMPPLFEAASALLVHLCDEPHFAITLPLKTRDYLAAGKPVITAVRGDAAQIVLRSGGGMVCEPEQPSQLAETIERLLSLSEAERAGRDCYTRNLSLGAGVDRFLALFRELQVALRENQGAGESPCLK